MADWKVIASRIKIFPHPNADSLELAKVGPFQLVVGKGMHQNGELVFFAPERSILPEAIRTSYVNKDTGISYLHGPEHDRVERIRLRGEYSEGALLDWDWTMGLLGPVLPDLTGNEDLSTYLGIIRYEPPIPADMAGELEPIEHGSVHLLTHDVEQYRLYAAELAGESVLVTEKVHGSQCAIFINSTRECFVTSKSFNKQQLGLKRSDRNLYWRAVVACGIEAAVAWDLPHRDVQIFAEVFPCQGGNWRYGATEPTLRIYRVIVDGAELAIPQVTEQAPRLFAWWVPVLHFGLVSPDQLVALAAGKEQVSGKELHIREGIVVSPAIPRPSREGFPLFLKIINPKFKDSETFVA